MVPHQHAGSHNDTQRHDKTAGHEQLQDCVASDPISIKVFKCILHPASAAACVHQQYHIRHLHWFVMTTLPVVAAMLWIESINVEQHAEDAQHAAPSSCMQLDRVALCKTIRKHQGNKDKHCTIRRLSSRCIRNPRAIECAEHTQLSCQRVGFMSRYCSPCRSSNNTRKGFLSSTANSSRPVLCSSWVWNATVTSFLLVVYNQLLMTTYAASEQEHDVTLLIAHLAHLHAP